MEPLLRPRGHHPLTIRAQLPSQPPAQLALKRLVTSDEQLCEPAWVEQQETIEPVGVAPGSHKEGLYNPAELHDSPDSDPFHASVFQG